MPKIYTKTGDKGKTSLYDGRRVSKASHIIELLGAIDELNAYLGILAIYIESEEKDLVYKRQNELMRLSAMIATYKGKVNPKKHFSINKKVIKELEMEMDKWQSDLPPLDHFILPGGNNPASKAHFARTLCRRAERILVSLHEQEPMPLVILEYMNRLGDWLFLFARVLNKGEDILWKVD
jgi:cob(I)alamin adenosyltransferase